MNHTGDPPRLRTSGASPDLLIQALDEARAELPDDRQIQGLAVGLAPFIGGPAVGPAPQGTPPLPGSTIHPVAGGLLAGKWSILSLVTGVGVGLVTWQLQSSRVTPPSPSDAPRAAMVATNSAPPMSAPAPVIPPIEEVAPASAAPPTIVPPTAARKPSVRAAPLPAPAPAGRTGADMPALGETGSETVTENESSLLGRAQRALPSDPAMALSLTDQHVRQFPGGFLVQERELIAIQALLAQGRRDQATARAVRFRSAFPGSAHLRRLDRLLGQGTVRGG